MHLACGQERHQLNMGNCGPSQQPPSCHHVGVTRAVTSATRQQQANSLAASTRVLPGSASTQATGSLTHERPYLPMLGRFASASLGSCR